MITKYLLSKLPLFLLLLYALSFIFRTDNSFDQDLGRHLKIGEIIFKEHFLPKTNYFSYTNPDFPFINHHYLFELLIYTLNLHFGWQSLLIGKITILLLAIFITLSLAARHSKILLISGFIFLHTLRERVDLRPEILSFLFTAINLYIWEKFATKTSRWIYLIPVLLVIWTNSHIYFFVGWGISVIYLIDFLVHKQMQKFKTSLICLSLGLFLSLINPNGFKALVYPFTVFNNYGYSIVENQNLFLLEQLGFHDPNYQIAKYIIFLSILALVISTLKAKINLRGFLTACFGITMALLNVRSLPYLFFLSLPGISAGLNFKSFGVVLKILTVITVIIMSFEGFYYLNGKYYASRNMGNIVKLEFAENIKPAADFMLANNLPTPIFNNFDIGSYLIYRGFPKVQIFIDGRPEAYPAEFFKQAYIPMQTDPSLFKQIVSQLNIQTIVFSHTDQTPWAKTFLKLITRDAAWKLVYIDEMNLVLIRSDLRPDLAKINLAQLSPETLKVNDRPGLLKLGIFLNLVDQPEAAQKFLKPISEEYNWIWW